MTLLSASALWPARKQAPLLRLFMAMTTAPAIVASVLATFSFLVAGMTETTAEGVWNTTIEAALSLTALVFAFTATFGLAGVVLLWRMARRGTWSWALAGAASGAIAGAMFSLVAMPGLHLPLVLAFALTGWALFLLIRVIAGVRSRVPAGARAAERAAERSGARVDMAGRAEPLPAECQPAARG